ncbi:hypothetical protein [Nocardia sp. NPDC052112]|uniref:hypothetical protein n=1 Tax=Nocardia sp. NPDC052112 TaxID=3155646 RepID=UPI00342C7FD6
MNRSIARRFGITAAAVALAGIGAAGAKAAPPPADDWATIVTADWSVVCLLDGREATCMVEHPEFRNFCANGQSPMPGFVLGTGGMMQTRCFYGWMAGSTAPRPLADGETFSYGGFVCVASSDLANRPAMQCESKTSGNGMLIAKTSYRAFAKGEM